MSAKTTIKKGYRLTVKSWENDADNPRTKIVEGYTLPQVKLMVELVKLHKSKSNNSGCYGNMYEPDDHEIAKYVKAMKIVFDKHPKEAWPEGMEDAFDDPDEDIQADAIHELMAELFGYSEYYFTRVYDGHIVEFIPEDILIEDVTANLDKLTA